MQNLSRATKRVTILVLLLDTYNLLAAVYALCLPLVAKFWEEKGTHAFHYAGGIGLISI
jgi:hypothetical protein